MSARIVWIAAIVLAGAAISVARYRSEDAINSIEQLSAPEEPTSALQSGSLTNSREPTAPPIVARSREDEPGRTTPTPATRVAPSRLESWLGARVISLPTGVLARVSDFAAEPRDGAWSAGMEERFVSEIARWNVTLADWHIECKRSRCVAALLYPAGSERSLAGTQPGPTLPQEHTQLTHATNLIGNAIWRLPTADGTIVELHNFHRRCGPDWKCLE